MMLRKRTRSRLCRAVVAAWMSSSNQSIPMTSSRSRSRSNRSASVWASPRTTWRNRRARGQSPPPRRNHRTAWRKSRTSSSNSRHTLAMTVLRCLLLQQQQRIASSHQ
uniref:Putative secreted protein n=1 Tax=Anopheles marajoara TaxID=58244 RepID=A0A2M4C8D1_9DIPT